MKKKSNPQGLAEGNVQIGAVVDEETLQNVDRLAEMLGWSRSRTVGQILSACALNLMLDTHSALERMENEGLQFEISNLGQIQAFPLFFRMVKEMSPEERKISGIRVLDGKK